MPLDVERFSEQATWVPPWIRHEHLARYEWACNYVAGRKVIDAACGTGYGTKMMAAVGAKSVDGFDISADAIEQALATGCLPEHLSFAVADVTRLPVASNSYDVYVCFETLEHIENDRALLEEAARVLKPDGKFLCSTPNRALLNAGTSIRDRPFNPFHTREYLREEFEALLREHFADVECFGQTMYDQRYGTALAKIGVRLPRLSVRVHQARKVVGIPWENREKHKPAAISTRLVPEMLVAVAAPAKTTNGTDERTPERLSDVVSASLDRNTTKSSGGMVARRLLGPLEPSVSRLYRSAFFRLRSLAREIGSWTDASRVLEVGCGDGLLTEWLAAEYPQAAITGIDIAPRVGRLFRGDRQRVAFLTTTLRDFASAKSGLFDLVVICDVLHHVPVTERPELLDDAALALSPSGAFVLKDWEKHINPIYLLGYFSDRFVTGDLVQYGTSGDYRTLVKQAFGENSIEKELRLPPWRNNVAFFCRKERE